MTIARIVSGGQTGADQGGWDAAIYCQLPYGGWVPRGKKTENGTIPDRFAGYTEHVSPDYLARTQANVVDSDATVVFSMGPPTGGSLRTVEFCQRHRRPCLAVDLREPREELVRKIVEWVKTDCPSNCTLNVAGSRESKSPGIGHLVMVRLIDVVSGANGTLFYPMGDEV
jgi:hypothetical protein